MPPELAGYVIAVFTQTAAVAVPAAPMSEVLVCDRMSTQTGGQLAPCTGILWGEDQTRAAIVCKDVTVPRLETDLKFIRDVAQIREQQRVGEIAFRDTVIQQMIANWPKPVNADVWQIAAAILGGVLTGAMTIWLL